MRKALPILLIALASVLSCVKPEGRRGADTPDGLRVYLNASRLYVGTRADVVPTDPAAFAVYDGSAIYMDNADPDNPVPDIIILIANQAGQIVARYPDPDTSDSIDSNLETVVSSGDMSVLFTGISQGTYSVYAFANTLGLWDMEVVDGESITPFTVADDPSDENEIMDFAHVTNASMLDHLQFAEHYVHPNYQEDIAVDIEPDKNEEAHRLIVRNGRLPLSAKVTGVSVSSDGNGHAELDMLRCVAKVTVEFKNLENYTLHLEHTWFRIMDICVCKGFVLPHGGHTMPEGIHWGTLVDQTGHADGEVLEIEGNSSFIRHFYVHPCTAPDPPGYFSMTCHLDFKENAGDISHDDELFPNMPIFTDHREDIFTLDRNEHLHIVCEISAGHEVSFNFEVVDWEGRSSGVPHVEEVTFD